jgi:L-lysine exporter family protein LysE/ArgO
MRRGGNMSLAALGTGFFLAASLLVAIGAQNAFVLRQGLRREHVLLVVCACVLYDWVLIGAGMGGLGLLIRGTPALSRWFGLAGAVFLLGYGAFAWRRALSSESLRTDHGGPALSTRAALLQCTAFTFLNPHVYLDTVVLIGSVGAQQPLGAQGGFFIGAGSASAAWFFSLGFGARFLAPLFALPYAWRLLDGIVGLTMFALAVLLGAAALRGA